MSATVKRWRHSPRRSGISQLSRNSQIDYEVFRQDLTRSIWLEENLHPFEEDPRVYGHYLSDSVYLPLAQSTLPKETNIANCLARMGQIPRIIAAAKANLRHPARPLLETAIRQNQGSIAFYEKDLFEFAGKTPQLAALKASAQRVAACLKEYQTFLEKELLPRATGEWRLGRDKFYRKLELDLDANLTADQVLAEAQAEFDRVQRDMYVVARQLWSGYYPGRALPPDDPAGRRETIQKVLDRIAQDHGRPETLTRDVRKAVAQIKRFIAEREPGTPSRPRLLPGGRDAGVRAWQFNRLHEFPSAPGPKGPGLLCRQPTAQGLECPAG